MTATRWWVKKYARWIARVQLVRGQLSLFFQGTSAVGIASGVLRYLGAPVWVVAIFALVFVFLVVAYIYLYSEGGVANQKNRDMQDMSNNFAGPNSRIQAELNARAFAAARLGRELTPEERTAASNEAAATYCDLRDGADIPDD